MGHTLREESKAHGNRGGEQSGHRSVQSHLAGSQGTVKDGQSHTSARACSKGPEDTDVRRKGGVGNPGQSSHESKAAGMRQGGDQEGIGASGGDTAEEIGASPAQDGG